MGSFIYDLLNYYSFDIKGTNFDLPHVIDTGRYIGMKHQTVLQHLLRNGNVAGLNLHFKK